MLRPSRPMIRPLSSSEGRCTTVTDASPLCSDAWRCIAAMRISRLRSAGLLADLGLGLADPLGDLGDELALDAAHDLDAGFLLGERGDPLELARDQRPLVLDGLAQRLELGFAPGQALLVRIELAQPALEPLLALVGPLLEPGDLRTALANLRLGFVATPGGLLLRGEEHRLGLLFGRPDLLEASFSVSVVRETALRHASARVQECCSRKRGRNNH